MSDGETSAVPSLYEVLQLAKDYPTAGEEHNLLTLALAMPMGGLIIFDGPSSSGKTHSVNSASSTFTNHENLVYTVPTTASETALYYEFDKMNQRPVHNWGDLASMEKTWEPILKDHGDGRPSNRKVTDVTLGEVVDKTIDPPATLILQIATDNEDINLNDYAEIKNRALILTSDGSREQTEAVMALQAAVEARTFTPSVGEERAAQIREYMTGVFETAEIFRTRRESEKPMATFWNPAAEAIAEAEVIPPMFNEARRDNQRLFKFMRAVALYHHAERLMTFLEDGERVMIVTPVDCWYAMVIFGEKMLRSALNLRGHDIEVLSLLREKPSSYTVAEIQQMLIQGGHNVTDRDVRRSLENMFTKGYVIRHDDSPITWQASPMASYMDYKSKIDWEGVVEKAAETVRANLPAEQAEKYVERYCSPEAMIVQHPITGETVNILEDTSLDEELSEAEDELKEVLSTPLYKSADDTDTDEAESEVEATPEPEPEADGSTQGTLTR
ncbi:hypothetical protein DU504_11705 [Haloplanus salinus]|uniref:Uncharacterized protein n=1 Tax=Haloplanus salinus TaxID=1126245 RepID=A0A368NBE9_9EURY|nr:hypothetical protein [Haloplanus salinus]RCU47897.1 hypothetical protein DU504_11705 [Haloplanus salinus]